MRVIYIIMNLMSKLILREKPAGGHAILRWARWIAFVCANSRLWWE